MPLRCRGCSLAIWPTPLLTYIHCEKVFFRTGETLCDKTKGTIHTMFLSSSSTTVLPIDQRKWNDILVGYFDEESVNVSKTMTRIPRHQGRQREKDEALEWRRLLPMFCRDHPDASKRTNQMWRDYLQRGSHKKRFQYCLDPNDFILYMSAIQGHSGKNKVDTTLQDNVEIPYKWMKYIYHARSTDDLHSSTQSGLIQEDKIRKKKDKRYSSQP